MAKSPETENNKAEPSRRSTPSERQPHQEPPATSPLADEVRRLVGASTGGPNGGAIPPDSPSARHRALLTDPRWNSRGNRTIQRAVALQLQRQYGNAYVGRLLGSDEGSRMVSGDSVVQTASIATAGGGGTVTRQPEEAASVEGVPRTTHCPVSHQPMMVRRTHPGVPGKEEQPMPSPAVQRRAAGQEVTSTAQAQIEEQKKSLQIMPAVEKEQPLQHQAEEGSTQTSSATVAKPATPVVKTAPSGTVPESIAPAPPGSKLLAVTSFITESAPTIEGAATDDASLSSAEFQVASGAPDTLTPASLTTEPAPRTQDGKTAGATVLGAAADVDALLPEDSALAAVGNAEVATPAEQDDEVADSVPPSDQAESATSKFITGLQGELGAVQAAADQSIESLRLAGRAQVASIRQELVSHIAAVRQSFGLQRANVTQETSQHRGELQAGAAAQEHQIQAASGAEVARARSEVGARQAQIESTGQTQAARVGTSPDA